ncbi:MAG: rRNA maturation RNase YbeY [Patescibacteria group bacterium]
MYERVKSDILGKEYSLSLAFISSKRSREINKKYRGVDKPTNVLAFPYSRQEGEILLTPSVIGKEAQALGKSQKEWERYLVIHGMLHLKGMRHGSKMEEAEEKYSQKHATKHLYRNSSWLRDGASRSRRISKRREIS